MKHISSIFAGLILALSINAHASDGKTNECFGLAVTVPSSFAVDSDWVNLKTEGSLCVVEKKVVDAGDELTSTGQFTITIRNGKGKKVAKYDFGAKSSEGAAGTIYTTYAKDVQALSTEDTWDKVTFRMRNDHIKKGQQAGSVTINGTALVLIQK